VNDKKLDKQTDEKKKKKTDTLVTEGQTKRKKEREIIANYDLLLTLWVRSVNTGNEKDITREKATSTRTCMFVCVRERERERERERAWLKSLNKFDWLLDFAEFLNNVFINGIFFSVCIK
jgi:hypothetical protein